MKLKKLGHTDLEVPILCLGTMTWGQQNTEAEAHQQLDYAVKERGLTFLDTAEMYPVPPEKSKQGRTESYIGSWLEKNKNRDKLIIATKIGAGNFVGTRDTGPVPHYDRKSVREAIDGSLKRLQTDYIDLYQVHFPERKSNFFGVRGYTHDQRGDSTPIAETLKALADLVKEGKVRYIGVSNESPWGVSEYLRLARENNWPKIVSIQNQYSLLNRTFEIGLAEQCINEDIGLLAYSPLNMGVLSGKYLEGNHPKAARFTLYERNRARYNPQRAQAAISEYVKLAESHGLNPAQMALAFVCSRDFVTSAIIGATTLEQLKTNIDSAEHKLSPEVLEAIEKIYNRYPDMTN